MRHMDLGVVATLILVACSGTDSTQESIAAFSQRLDDPAAVLGFENPSFWSASSGTKSASTDRSQGAQSLSLSSFTYAELSSPALSNLSGVTSSIAFDLKAPVSPAWGQAALAVSVPSRGIYNTQLGQVALAGTPGGSFRTLSFNVPSNVLSALGQSYSDLKFKVMLNVPQTSQAYLIDNLRFVGGSSQSQVTLDVSGVDDFVYLVVNGVRRKVLPWGGTVSALDVSHWFSAGSNSVRVQAVNTGGPASYSVTLKVDGATVVDANCANAPCTPATPGGAGIVFDQTYQVATPNRPAASTLTINGTSGAKIYIDDAYTGRSVPASIALPLGQYRVGVGVGEGTPRFYEQTVNLGAGGLGITPTSGAALDFPNHTRVALLPIRTTIHGEDTEANRGVLSAEDITVMAGQTFATRDAYVKPFSYGLTTWDIEVLPVVENTPLYRGANGGDSPNIGRFLSDANLTSLEQQYDIVIYFFSKYTASGAVVANDPCCWWGINQLIAFPNHLTRRSDWPANRPNFYLLHESLHDYESYNHARLHFYNGADGTHGAGTHGYLEGANGQEDFLFYYQNLMRNQVAEVKTMRSGANWSGSLPTQADLWVGLFDTFRRDVDWQATPPIAGALLASSGKSIAPAGSRFQPTCALQVPENP